MTSRASDQHWPRPPSRVASAVVGFTKTPKRHRKPRNNHAHERPTRHPGDYSHTTHPGSGITALDNPACSALDGIRLHPAH